MTVHDTVPRPSEPSPVATLRERFERLEAPRIRPGWRAWAWTVCGVLGDRLLRRPPPEIRTPGGARLLHLGCGARRFAGWVNADFYRLTQLLARRDAPDWMLDLTRPFPCPDDHWDGVFLEHVNEHLSYGANLALLQEVLRTLRPGGLLRLAVPSLQRYLAWETLRREEPKMARYASLAEAVSNLTQNHAHQSVWDPTLMREVLEQVGFTAVTERGFREGELADLLRDGESHRWESLYVEARKPQATASVASAA